MAYDASNNNTDQQQVAGSTPLGQGGSTPASNPTPESNSAPSAPTPTVGTSSTGATSQGPSQNDKSKASSGMFTNIQKYVQKNQPQAQKISGAVTQDVGNQASEIRQQAEQKTAQTKQQLDANQSAIDEQKQFAQNQVNAILNPQAPSQQIPPLQSASQSDGRVAAEVQPTVINPYAATQTDAERFQQLMRGELQGVNQVQGINLAQQQSKAQALQNLASGVRTEQGRKNLLANTFSDDGQYTRGMSGLDQLILSGDDSARNNLIEGIQNQAGTLSDELTGIEGDIRNQIASQNRTFDQFGNEVTNLAESSVTDIDSQMDQAYQTALSERAALLDPSSVEYQAAKGGAEARLAELNSILGSKNDFIDYAQQFAGKDEKGGYRSSHNVKLEKYFDDLQEFRRTGQVRAYVPVTKTNSWGDEYTKNELRILTGKDAKDHFNKGISGISHGREREQVRSFYDKISKDLIGADENQLYGLNHISRGGHGDYANKFLTDINSRYKDLAADVEGLGSADDIIQRRLGKEGGTNYESVLRGDDLSKYEVAGDENINKFNALKQLMGKQDIIANEMIDKDGYLTQEQLKNLLAGYLK